MHSALSSQVLSWSLLELVEPVSWSSPSQPSTINWSFHPISWSNYETSSIKSKCHKKCKFQAKPTQSKLRDKVELRGIFLKPPALCYFFLQAISLYLITDNNSRDHNYPAGSTVWVVTPQPRAHSLFSSQAGTGRDTMSSSSRELLSSHHV